MREEEFASEAIETIRNLKEELNLLECKDLTERLPLNEDALDIFRTMVKESSEEDLVKEKIKENMIALILMHKELELIKEWKNI